MSATTFLALAAVAWVLIGATASIAMGRRGHNAFGWLLLGAMLGPLVVPLAFRLAREERSTGPSDVHAGRTGAGPVDVLIGIDGSATSEEALRTAVRLLGGRIGRLTLASVIEHGSTPSLRADEDRAVARLEELALSVPRRLASTAILRGEPAAALGEHATDGGYELLVVGRRGRGATKALIGSTATRLARAPEVPVLIV